MAVDIVSLDVFASDMIFMASFTLVVLWLFIFGFEASFLRLLLLPMSSELFLFNDLDTECEFVPRFVVILLDLVFFVRLEVI